MKKYEFTGEVDPVGLKRIRRISNGEIGGWIESESNLSHYDDCWVADEARVYNHARLAGHAQIRDHAQVFDRAQVVNHANISGYAQICDYARVSDRARAFGYAVVHSHAQLRRDAQVSGGVYNLLYACEFNVTAYNNFVQIGCKLHTIDEWQEIFAAGAYQSLCTSVASYKRCQQVFEFFAQLLEEDSKQ